MSHSQIMQNLSKWNAEYDAYLGMFRKMTSAIVSDQVCVDELGKCGVRALVNGGLLQAEYIGRKFSISLRFSPGKSSPAMIVCRELLSDGKLSQIETSVHLDSLGNVRASEASPALWAFTMKTDATTVFLYVIQEFVRL